MPWSRPKSRQPRETLVARCGGDHGGAGGLGELDGGQTHAAGPRLHQHGLARPEVAELEQAVVGGGELDRHAAAASRRRGRRAPATRLAAGTPTSSAWDPAPMVATTGCPTPKPLDPVAHLAHDAGRLVAHDVGRPRDSPLWRCSRSPPWTPTAHLDDDTARPQLGSGTSS